MSIVILTFLNKNGKNGYSCHGDFVYQIIPFCDFEFLSFKISVHRKDSYRDAVQHIRWLTMKEGLITMALNIYINNKTLKQCPSHEQEKIV